MPRINPRLLWLPAVLWAVCAQAATLEVHYAPTENLEPIDVELINQAERAVDMAAYVLTDEAVIDALGDAADRGVSVRIYLDPGEFRTRSTLLTALVARPGVEVRLKPGGALMHMKAYAVDGTRLRTGSGNFSHSGLTRQDNDLVVSDDAQAVQRFERDFDAIWSGGATP